MTSREYLLSQAEYCRRTADDSADRFVAAELNRLAKEFEEKARDAIAGASTALQKA